MPYKVTLGNPSKTTRRRPGSDPIDGVSDDGKISMSRLTYQALGSLVQNKKILELYNENKLPLEYLRTLDELNDLYLKRNYPGLYDGSMIKDGIVALDKYLGSLGVDIEYPYSKDAVDIAAWLYVESQTEYRILIDETDNTYLTDGSANVVLIYYT